MNHLNVVACEACGHKAWIITETPSGPTITCTRCGATVNLEQAVNLEGVRRD